jgi:glycosyltransferase involved in cell wall biosynthesis
MTPTRLPTVAVIPAKDEAARIAATIATAQQLEGVELVVVVDDGSRDATASLAGAAGAQVARHERNHGKAAAMATGATMAASLLPGEHLLLFVDADLEHSAAALGVLIEPVASGEADMSIAVLPPQRAPGGGHGFVVRLARRGIEDLTGWAPTQPLSGMRCLNRTAYLAGQPFAPGWGVEVGLTIDTLLAGLRVVEVPCELHHRVTGSNWRGQLHRARQYRDVALALAQRRLARRRKH